MKFFSTRKTGDIITRFSDAFTIKDIFTNICIILLIISLVADVAIVTYSIRLTYLYSALLFIQVKKLKNKH